MDILKQIFTKLVSIETSVKRLGLRVQLDHGDIMATLKDLDDVVAALIASQATLVADNTANMAAIQAAINEITALIAKGGSGLSAADQAQFDAAIAKLQGAVTASANLATTLESNTKELADTVNPPKA